MFCRDGENLRQLEALWVFQLNPRGPDHFSRKKVSSGSAGHPWSPATETQSRLTWHKRCLLERDRLRRRSIRRRRGTWTAGLGVNRMHKTAWDPLANGSFLIMRCPTQVCWERQGHICPFGSPAGVLGQGQVRHMDGQSCQDPTRKGGIIPQRKGRRLDSRRQTQLNLASGSRGSQAFKSLERWPPVSQLASPLPSLWAQHVHWVLMEEPVLLIGTEFFLHSCPRLGGPRQRVDVGHTLFLAHRDMSKLGRAGRWCLLRKEVCGT